MKISNTYRNVTYFFNHTVSNSKGNSVSKGTVQDYRIFWYLNIGVI